MTLVEHVTVGTELQRWLHMPDCIARRPNADDFLRMLHPSGFRDLRAIHDDANPKVIAESVPTSDLAAVRRFIETHGRDRNLYVGVASRNGHGRSTEHCLALDVLFVDLDVKQFAGGEAEARARLEAFPLAPTAVVVTGGGLHVYWWLLDPIDLQQNAPYARAILRAMATHLGADLDAAEPARVLRLPDTINHKYDPPRPVILETFDFNRRHPLADFGDLLTLGIEAELKRLESIPEPGPPVKHDIRVEARILLAKAWLARQPGAVEGHAGDKETFTVCSAVTRGFDLSDGEAFEAFEEWNTRCVPPWPASQLKTKIHNGREYGTEPIGGRLHARDTPPKAPRIEVVEDLHAFLARMQNQPALSWHIDGLVPDEGICRWHGQPRDFKSMCAQEVALALASGRNAFNLPRFAVRRAIRVCFFTEEDPERLFAARMHWLTARNPSPAEGYFFPFIRRSLSFDLADDRNFILSKIGLLSRPRRRFYSITLNGRGVARKALAELTTPLLLQPGLSGVQS